MNKVELLAPAGNVESVYAAVQSGADAVYLGGNRFSARAYADNFDDESMKRAVDYCHLYNVKIYVTINTIMKETELEDAVSYAGFLNDMGVDALIVQDIGFTVLVKKYFPDFEIHASTQMTVHNLEAALFLEKIGFDRIVLSRELSLKEIEIISKNLNIDTEVFIHGALCVCYSGQCIMSSMIGGRSGNRGRCAQPCRLPYSIVKSKDGFSRKGYLLSTKDMCTIENIGDILKSGVCSLKIEGRMKRPEYVAGVVGEYRRAIDSYLDNNIKKFPMDKSIKNLLQLFNREGFTKAYLLKNVGRDMMSYAFPRNMGVEVGKIQNDMMIILKEDISVGDGIRNGKDGFYIHKIIKDGRKVDKAKKGDSVKIFPLNYRCGNTIYRTSDSNQIKKLQYIYKNPYGKKMGLSLKVKFELGKPIELMTNYDRHNFVVKGETVEKALKRPISKERICSSLLKTGNTVFRFDNIELINYEEGFLPVSSLNSLRRKLIAEIQEYILSKSKNRCCTENVKHIIPNRAFKNIFDLPEKIVLVSNKEQLKAVIESNLDDCICINPFQRSYEIKLKDIHKKVYIMIPNIVKEEFNYMCKFIQDNFHKIRGIVTSNLGIISKFRGKMSIIGDYKLNIFNSEALKFYNNLTSVNCLSVELSKYDMKNILNNIKSECQVMVYGRIQLMVSEYCVIGSTFGGRTASKKCNNACSCSSYFLVDRKNKRFPLMTDEFCRGYIYNSVPLNLLPNIKELKNMGIKSFRIDFLDEDYEQAKDILKSFTKEKWDKDFSKFTRGHYKEGAE
ncbi:DUF3656 domain-containing U32 family peptidase [Clostridium sp. LBM24168]